MPLAVPAALAIAALAGWMLLEKENVDPAVIQAMMTPFMLGVACAAQQAVIILKKTTGFSAIRLSKVRAKRALVRWTAESQEGVLAQGVALVPNKKTTSWRMAWVMGLKGRVENGSE